MGNVFKTKRIFFEIALVIIFGVVVYTGFQKFAELQNQLASLQGQLTPVLEEPAEELIVPVIITPTTTVAFTTTTASETELESEPNPCDSLNCNSQDGWVKSGSVFTCQEGNKTCACQTQAYYDYSCSSSGQECVYSTTNTRTSKSNCLEPKYPDLVAQSPTFSPAVPAERNNMTFWATVKNQGNGPAVSSLSYVSIDGQKFSEFSTPDLTSNEAIVVTGSAVWQAVVGEHELRVCADGAGILAESNEINNCATITFSVTGTIPDLVITSVDIAPDPLRANQPLSFAANVKNQGGAPAKPSVATLRLDIGNNGDWDIIAGAVSIPTLAINGAETALWREVWAGTAGTHKFEICADAVSEPEFRITESIETNNCSSRIFVIP